LHEKRRADGRDEQDRRRDADGYQCEFPLHGEGDDEGCDEGCCALEDEAELFGGPAVDEVGVCGYVGNG
jgi:hypothetical protein